MAAEGTGQPAGENATVLAAIKEAHASWSSAYESLRPTGEVDSRAKLVLASSLALIALCLATEKPDSINVLGFTFNASHWLLLGIPLMLTVLYSVVQLVLAWTVQSSKIEHTMFPPMLSIRTWLDEALGAQFEKTREFFAEAEEVSRRRAELSRWHHAQTEVVFQRNMEELKDPDAMSDPDFSRRAEQRWADLETEYAKRRAAAGLAAHEEKVDAVLDDLLAGRKSADLVLAEDALRNMRKLVRIRKARSLLDLVIPTVVAAIGIYVFTIALVFPSYLNTLGTYLPRKG
jgi:hypothetical protein